MFLPQGSETWDLTNQTLELAATGSLELVAIESL